MIQDHYNGDLGPIVKQVGDMMESELNKALRDSDLTSTQARLLITLGLEDDGTLTQREIEELFLVSHPTVVGVVGRLRAKGLVEVSSPGGRSSKAVTITGAGREAMDRIYGPVRHIEDVLVRGMDDSERAALYSLVLRMHSNLAAERGRERCLAAACGSC